MLQIENEYGSFGNDRNYLSKLKDICGPRTELMCLFLPVMDQQPICLRQAPCPDVLSGLIPAADQSHFELAAKMNPGVPVFSSETYPGWLTHWGEKWARPDTTGLLKEVKFLMDNKKSFNFYVIHGGTNFGFTAGANSGGKGYEPDVTSYDYDAPVDEQGRATPKYMAFAGF